MFKKTLVAAAVTFGIGATTCGCTTQQTTQLTTAAGAVCAIIVQATNPALAPLCTTAEQLALALEAVIEGSADGGTGVMSPADEQDAVYNWLQAHGAVPVASR